MSGRGVLGGSLRCVCSIGNRRSFHLVQHERRVDHARLLLLVGDDATDEVGMRL